MNHSFFYPVVDPTFNLEVTPLSYLHLREHNNYSHNCKRSLVRKLKRKSFYMFELMLIFLRSPSLIFPESVKSWPPVPRVQLPFTPEMLLQAEQQPENMKTQISHLFCVL